MAYRAQSARDAEASGYGGRSYWDYLERHAQEPYAYYALQGEREEAERMLTQTLSLVGNEGGVKMACGLACNVDPVHEARAARGSALMVAWVSEDSAALVRALDRHTRGLGARVRSAELVAARLAYVRSP
jgi:hypothetical protein